MVSPPTVQVCRSPTHFTQAYTPLCPTQAYPGGEARQEVCKAYPLPQEKTFDSKQPMLLNAITFPADLTPEQDPPSPGHCCLLVLNIFVQSSHCPPLTVPLHDTLTSYCSCMNKSVFPNEQGSRLALETRLVQQQLLHVANPATHGLCTQ